MSDYSRPICVPTPDGRCTICSDEATLAIVTELDANGGAAVVTPEGNTSTIALDLIDGVDVGDAVLVHMGFAIARVGGANLA